MKSGLKIFVVDDEPVIATTLATILQRSGFEVDFFTAPLEALRAAADKQPHLLISDVVMPGLSGVELAIQLRLLCPECKILLFSGQAATSDLLTDARRQGYDFTLLQKPIHPTDLLNTIRGMDPELYSMQRNTHGRETLVVGAEDFKHSENSKAGRTTSFL